MRILIQATFLIIGVFQHGADASARPKVSVSVSEGNFADLSAVDPAVTCVWSSKSGNIDLEYGIEAAARSTDDISSLPKKLWGRATREISGWRLSARADVKGSTFNNADLQIDISNEANDFGVKMLGDVTKKGSLASFSFWDVQVNKGVDTKVGSVVFKPSYDIQAQKARVGLGYKVGGTEVQLSGSLEDQKKVLFLQKLGENNRIRPSFSTEGDIEVGWDRDLGDDTSVSATLRMNKSVDVVLRKSAMSANIRVPIDGSSIRDTKVNFKSDFSL